MPRSGTAGSHGKSVFRLWRKLHTAFQSGCGDFHSHKQGRRLLSSPHRLQHLLFADLLMMPILTGVSWYVVTVLIRTAHKQQYWASFRVPVGHLCVLFGEISFHVFCPFSEWAVCFDVVQPHKLFLETNPTLVTSFANIFSQSLDCLFVYCFLCCAEAFEFK